jgi:hypothetical protein
MTGISTEGVIEETEYPRMEELVYRMTRIIDHVKKLYVGDIEYDPSEIFLIPRTDCQSALTIVAGRFLMVF